MRIKELTFAVMLLGTASNCMAALYSIEILPNFPGAVETRMTSINDHGTVVGDALYSPYSSGIKKIIKVSRDSELEVIVDNLQQEGLNVFTPKVNNSGQITYTHNLRPAVFNDLIRTYRYSPGIGIEELASPDPLLSYVPLDLNEGGDVLGQSLNSGGRIQNSVVWRASGSSTVIHSSYRANSITNDRTLTGSTPIGGFVWREGRDPQFLTYPSTNSTTGNMNALGQVKGGYSGGNWLWAPDLQSHIEIPIDGGVLLDDGTIVGGVNREAAPFRSLGKWSPEQGYEEITEMLDSAALAHGFDRWSLRDVNQRGEILASAWTYDPNNEFYEPRFNVILRSHPVPEPGTVLALGAGLAAFLRRRRTT